MLFLPYNISLKNTEIDIYNYIINNLNQVGLMRIRELADATHVSSSTILRFCRKFECTGYAEFRLRLQAYNKSLGDHRLAIAPVDEFPFLEFLKHTHYPDFQEKITAAANILLESDLVLFVGVGTSGIFSRYGSYLFSSLVSLALNIEDPLNMPLYNLVDNRHQKICLVALSVSGENESIINYINHLKAHHAKIISLTNSGNSTIAQLSSVNIAYYNNLEMYEDTNITSQLAVTYILEALARTAHQAKCSS